MIFANRGVRDLADYAFGYARVADLPVEVPLAHLLLTAIGVAGDRMVWRPTHSRTPRFGRASVSFLAGQGERPEWYLRQCLPVVEWHVEAQKYAASRFTPKVTAAEIRHRRKQIERLKNLFPRAAENWAFPETSGTSVTQADFLIHVRSRVPCLRVPNNGFGYDRLAFLFNEKSYAALNRSSGNGPALKAAALNDGKGLRATLNGWVLRKDFQRLLRKLAPQECAAHGWLLPTGDSPSKQVSKISPGEILQHPLGLRFLEPVSAYKPWPVVGTRLNRADHEWRAPEWCDHEPLRSLLRADEELAWQLATALRVIDLATSDEHRKFDEQAELAITLAAWIRAAHCREIRMLFPGPREEPSDRLSQDVVDRLLKEPRTVRDLCRANRRAKAADIRRVLERMALEGWVTEEDKRWRLDFPDLPEVSTILSKFTSEGQKA